MPALPHTLRRAIYAPVTSEDLTALMTIVRPGSTVRLSSRASERFSLDPLREGVTHQGEIYEHAILAAGEPDDDAASLPSFSVLLASIDGLRGLSDENIEACTVALKDVIASDPEIVVTEYPSFVIGDVVEGEETIALELRLLPVEDEPCPAHSKTKGRCPGLFP